MPVHVTPDLVPTILAWSHRPRGQHNKLFRVWSSLYLSILAWSVLIVLGA